MLLALTADTWTVVAASATVLVAVGTLVKSFLSGQDVKENTKRINENDASSNKRLGSIETRLALQERETQFVRDWINRNF